MAFSFGGYKGDPNGSINPATGRPWTFEEANQAYIDKVNSPDGYATTPENLSRLRESGVLKPSTVPPIDPYQYGLLNPNDPRLPTMDFRHGGDPGGGKDISGGMRPEIKDAITDYDHAQWGRTQVGGTPDAQWGTRQWGGTLPVEWGTPSLGGMAGMGQPVSLYERGGGQSGYGGGQKAGGPYGMGGGSVGASSGATPYSAGRSSATPYGGGSPTPYGMGRTSPTPFGGSGYSTLGSVGGYGQRRY